jgi:hypothetical protein
VALLVIAVAGDTPLAAVIRRGAGGVNPQIASLAFDACKLSLYSLSAPAALLSVLAPIIVIWRSGALPRWLVVLGSVEIVVNLTEMAGPFVRTGRNAGGYVWGIGPLIWAVWVAAVSVAMLTKGASDSSGVPTSSSRSVLMYDGSHDTGAVAIEGVSGQA